jgi:hypothetical protein
MESIVLIAAYLFGLFIFTLILRWFLGIEKILDKQSDIMKKMSELEQTISIIKNNTSNQNHND